MKSLGPEEAAKCRPSNLSIEVWRLMENARKNDGDGDRSDENSQEDPDNPMNLQTILDKLTASAPEVMVNEIKVEADSDDYDTEEEARTEIFTKKSSPRKKRPRISDDEPMDLAEQRVHPPDTNARQFDNGTFKITLKNIF